jgi:hypothetical protein
MGRHKRQVLIDSIAQAEKETRKRSDILLLYFDITPKEAIPQVERAVDLFYKNRRKPDRPNQDQQK